MNLIHWQKKGELIISGTNETFQDYLSSLITECCGVISRITIIVRSFAEDSNDGGVGTRVLSTFLNELDGIAGGGKQSRGDVLVIVACSSVSNLDGALTRPGRLQYHFVFGYLSYIDLCEIVSLQLKKIPPEVYVQLSVADIAHMITELCGPRASAADVAMICGNAMLFAVSEQLRPLNFGHLSVNSVVDITLSKASFLKSIEDYTGKFVREEPVS